MDALLFILGVGLFVCLLPILLPLFMVGLGTILVVALIAAVIGGTWYALATYPVLTDILGALFLVLGAVMVVVIALGMGAAAKEAIDKKHPPKKP